MQAEDRHKMSASTWQERLARLEEEQGSTLIPEGFCKVGCSRKVHPGTTRAGRPFTTCCKGCIMGFGHDASCGTADASKMGAGLCKAACGRKVAEGRDAKGRALDTCCKSCALGLGRHDDACGNKVVVPTGSCSMACGRAVAEGLQANGKPWNSCCKGCGVGIGHDVRCKEVGPGGAAVAIRHSSTLASSGAQSSTPTSVAPPAASAKAVVVTPAAPPTPEPAAKSPTAPVVALGEAPAAKEQQGCCSLL